MFQERLYQEINDNNILLTDDQFEYDQNIYKVALEKHNLNCTHNHRKCTACDGIGYFYLSDHRLIQCERCNGKGQRMNGDRNQKY
jgi:DnaJ-class molecular chaperone